MTKLVFRIKIHHNTYGSFSLVGSKCATLESRYTTIFMAKLVPWDQDIPQYLR